MLSPVPSLLSEASGLPTPRLEFTGRTDADPTIRIAGRLLVMTARGNARSGAVADGAREAIARASRHGPDAIPLLVVPFMGEAGHRICREANVAYLDLSGNVDITAPPLVLRVHGRPNRFAARGRPSSVFAPKSSRVTRLLLHDPSRWWRQQELAEEGEMGPGYVSRICHRLEDERFIDRNEARSLRPRDPKVLLRAWEDVYRFEDHDVLRGHIPARSGEELTTRVADALRSHDVPHAFTGLAAAWFLAPFARFRLVAVYVAEPLEEQRMSSLGWRAGAQGANLWITTPKDEGVFHGSQEVLGIACTSPVQTVLDLKGMPERADEAAAHLRREIIPWA